MQMSDISFSAITLIVKWNSFTVWKKPKVVIQNDPTSTIKCFHSNCLILVSSDI